METKNYEKAFKTKKNKKNQSFLHTNIANLPHPQQRTLQHFFFQSKSDSNIWPHWGQMLLSDLLWSPGPWEAVKDDVYGKSSCQADPLHARGGSRSALVIGGSRSALVSHQARVFFLFSGFAAELEVQRWLASNGFALPISERPATPQCFQDTKNLIIIMIIIII